MKILVTGAAGFIGYHVANALLEDGHAVVGLDNFNAYYSVRLKRDRQARLKRHRRYLGLTGDLCANRLLLKLCREQAFDRVCHLAGQVGVRYSLTHPRLYQKSNLEGFFNVLEACRDSKVPRLVYASSSSVYGGNRKLPFKEDDPVDTPISLYAATKKANELMAHAYSHLYGLQAIGLRFFTVYGPWGRPDMAVWSFTEKMLKGQPIPVFNHGRMRRDFTYIDDIVSGVKAALLAKKLGRYEIINLGHHSAENLMEVIERLAAALGVKPKLKFLPMQPGDVPETYADIARARRLLGFKPATSIAAGLPRFVAWYREYHK